MHEIIMLSLSRPESYIYNTGGFARITSCTVINIYTGYSYSVSFYTEDTGNHAFVWFYQCKLKGPTTRKLPIRFQNF